MTDGILTSAGVLRLDLLPFFEQGNFKTMTAAFKKRFLFILLIFFAGFLALEAVILVSGWLGNSALCWRNPDTSAFIQDFEIKTGQRVKIQWRDLEQISENLIKAVVVSEDDAFFQHEGIDLKELKASWRTNWRRKRISRGGSTITMQLVKNLYLNPRKNPFRKLNEIILAMDLETKVSKGRILEVYLNLAEWGYGIFGAEAATRHYFGKASSQLSPSEAAYLAALLPNPVYLSSKGSDRAQKRKASILNRMWQRPLPGNF